MMSFARGSIGPSHVHTWPIFWNPFSFDFSAASKHEERIGNNNEGDGNKGGREMIQKVLGYVVGYH